MMPAPISTMSGAPGFCVCIIGPPFWSAARVGDERDLYARAKYHIGPAPRILVDKLPAMPGSRGVLSKQDVTGMQHEVIARARLEIERPAQCYDELASRRVVPFEGAAGSRLAERDADDVNGAAENVTAFAFGKVNYPFLEMRIAIVSGPKPNTAYH